MSEVREGPCLHQSQAIHLHLNLPLAETMFGTAQSILTSLTTLTLLP